MRGTRRRTSANRDNDRFIPACAGNTSTRREPRAAAAVHPRVCGEHLTLTRHFSLCPGSSPRVRGTRQPLDGGVLIRRFIPACAGNTDSDLLDAVAETVHPRVCGEHMRSSRVCPVDGGSSPRVRGTPNRRPATPPRSRFIPACAGNTRHPDATGTSGSVHPRVCGEHGVCVAGLIAWIGSSPRVRGTLVASRLALAWFRFIPACAGNTGVVCSRIRQHPVHPRVCGEHASTSSRRIRRGGSSPRVRGTRLKSWTAKTGKRFIPACAGNTGIANSPCAAASVHPRVCGEHDLRRQAAAPDHGSSPRVRGTLRVVR